MALHDGEAWSGERKPTHHREAAAFQAFRVVDDIALADMLAEAMRARQDERMQEIGKRIKRLKEMTDLHPRRQSCHFPKEGNR